MNKEDILAVCPQCGAQGKAGRFCEYCGTKIPKPVIENKQEDDDNIPFSWYNVIPVGYQMSEKHVIGDSQKSLYMVVKCGETRQYVQTEFVREFGNYGHTEIRTRDKEDYKYGIINRQGKFVVDCNKEHIYLHQETNYYYYSSYGEECILQNLVSGNIVVNDKKYDLYYVHGTTFMGITDRIDKKFSLFDMKTNRFIGLPPELIELNTKYERCFMHVYYKEGKFEFYKYESSGDYDNTKTVWNVKIEGGRAEIIDRNVKTETPGCFGVIVLAIAIPLSLLYFL